ncbi:MAG TPA: peptidoglycan DD-metalloendopeptidase family protein [Gemmatimonas sp.]|nr:peptidoglycan DD-metalloendopeptidase family protein [Gemmatimonas sp.]
MKRSRLTLLIAAGTLTLGAAAISIGRPVSGRPAASVLVAGPRVSAAPALVNRWRTQVDTVRRGELLVSVLKRAGMAHDEAVRAITASGVVDPRRIRPGTTVTTRVHVDSGPAEIVLQLAIDRLVRLSRAGDRATGGALAVWNGVEEKLPWTTDTVVVAGVVRSTLVAALKAGGEAFPAASREEVAFALADILEYRVDLSRDLHVGDTVKVLVEREQAPGGHVRAGNILAARLTLDGRRVETIRFANGDRGTPARTAYFDGEGKTMRAAFLRAPLAFRRISSVFGLRKHPILGVWRAHQGMDYSAASGTPVRALGDGTVVFAGWKGGYGRVVEIRHRNGYVTRYGHLKGFANGIRRGASVAISRTIGYVGSTGLATAPHLHFEVMVGGKHRDPRVALRSVTGEPLSSSLRSAFAEQKAHLLAMLERGSSPRSATTASFSLGSE